MLRILPLVVFFAPLSQAQTAFNLPSLPTSSAEAAGARPATLRPAADPTGAVLNPAFLGALDGFRVTGTMASELFGDVQPGSFALSYGTEVTLGRRSFSVGVGLVREGLDYGSIPVTTGDPSDPIPTAIEAEESAYGLGVAARGTAGGVDVSAGLGGYVRNSDASFYEEGPDRAVTLDLGLLAEAPIVRASQEAGDWSFPVSVIGGAVVRNLTVSSDLPERNSLGSYQVTMPPREVVVGGGGRVSVARGVRDGALPVASLDVRLEQEQSQADGVRFAFDLSVLDALSLRSGAFAPSDETYLVMRGASIGLSIDGALRSLGALFRSESVQSLGDDLVFQVSYGSYDYADRDDARGEGYGGSEFVGITLGWRP